MAILAEWIIADRAYRTDAAINLTNEQETTL